MATGLQALNGIESATHAIQSLVQMVRAIPPGQKRQTAQAQVNRLAGMLLQLETAAQQKFTQAIRLPIVVPEPRAVFDWVGSIRRAGNVQGHLMRITVPDALVQAAGKLLEECGAVAQWIQTSPATQTAPQRANLGAVPAAAVAAVAVPAMKAAIPPEIIMGKVAAAASFGLSVYAMMKERKAVKNRRSVGLEVDDDEDPQVIRRHAQSALDNEVPGSTVSLSPKPDGEWVASVKHGARIIARARGKKPQDVAGQAITQALEWDEARTLDVDADVIDVTPKKHDRADSASA